MCDWHFERRNDFERSRMRERCYLKEKEEGETERRWNYEKDVYLDEFVAGILTQQFVPISLVKILNLPF